MKIHTTVLNLKMEKEKGKSCDTQAVKDINKSERSIKKATGLF